MTRNRWLGAAVLLAYLCCGCGGTAFDAVVTDNGTDQGPVLRGAVRLTPTRPVTGAPVRVLDPEGQELAVTQTDETGFFGVRADGLDAGYRIEATAPDGTILRAHHSEATSNDPRFTLVDPLSTMVARWHELNSDQNFAQSRAEILDYLAVPQASGDHASSDDSTHSDFDADKFLERANKQGGVEALIDTELARLKLDSEAVSAFVTDPNLGNLDEQLLAVLRDNLAGPLVTAPPPAALTSDQSVGIGPAVVLGPIASYFANWLAGKLGLVSAVNSVQQLLQALNALSDSVRAVNDHLSQLLDLVLDEFYEDAEAELNAPYAQINAEERRIAQIAASPTAANLESALAGAEASANNLTTQLALVDAALRGDPLQSNPGLLGQFVARSKCDKLINQAQFDAMAFLVARQRVYQVRGLQTLLERTHQSIQSISVDRAALAFDREMLRIRLCENEVVKQLEMTGADSARTLGVTHAQRNWAPRAIPLDLLQNLRAHGLESPGFDVRISEHADKGSRVLAVKSTGGIQAGNNAVLGRGADQETVVVLEIIPGGLRISPTTRAHPFDSPLRGANGAAIALSNVLYDKDGDLVWLLPSANYWTRTDLGYKESGVKGWLTPTPQQLSHLFSHLSRRSVDKLQSELGFRNLDTKSIHFCASSSRLPFNFLDAFYNCTSDSAFPIPGDDNKNENAWRFEMIYFFLPQQILVMEPNFGLSSLRIDYPKPAGATGAVVYPTSKLQLSCVAVCANKQGDKQEVDLTQRAVWTVVATSPRTFDPLTAGVGQYLDSRLRISNAPGSQGELSVRTLAGDRSSSPNETYRVQAQLGSNTVSIPITVNVGGYLSDRTPDLYVSHAVQQNHFIAPTGTSNVELKVVGRIRPGSSRGMTAISGAVGGIDVPSDITLDDRLKWRILGDGSQPDPLKIARLERDDVSQRMLLIIDRNVPGHAIPAGGTFITVETRWSGSSDPPAAPKIATTRIQVLGNGGL